MLHLKVLRSPILTAASLVFAVAAAPGAGYAASGGPFKPFLGSWQGGGSITSSNGQREAITCRATYQSEDGQSLSQSLVCASDSFRVNIECSLTADGDRVRGQWQETTRGVRGNISGEVSRGDFEGTVDGGGFTAQVSLRSIGKRQQVRIQPSAGDVQSVDVSLTRRK